MTMKQIATLTSIVVLLFLSGCERADYSDHSTAHETGISSHETGFSSSQSDSSRMSYGPREKGQLATPVENSVPTLQAAYRHLQPRYYERPGLYVLKK